VAVDLNCIKEGIIPTKHCDKNRQNLYSANGSSLEVSHKLHKGYINVQNYSFKNVFIIVKNITNDIILGTRFLSQIYPFYTDNIGVHIQVMGNTISFPFLFPNMQLEISQLQNSLSSEQTTLKLIQKQISYLKEEYSYHRIDE